MTITNYHEDSEVAKGSENSLTLPGSDDLDFSKYWVKPRIDVEVIRGKKLREQKLKSHSIAREYDVFDIDFDKPSCSTTPIQSSTRYYGRSTKHNTKKKRHKSPIKIFNKSKVKRQSQRKCPMRISELAVPTKRHCIETWRNKRDTLPSFMVERLRQIIMDEKPIVKIHDAINCFKSRKRSVKSRSEILRYPNVRKTNLDQIKLFSGIFGYKISRKLIAPLNITLNPQLKKISKIVNDEISLILSKSHQTTQEMNLSIQTEIAEKVTIWITHILEDASYKLLLEDFQELEEEEGVVWEIIDELIDNVVDISEPDSLPSITEFTSISETQSDLSHEIPTIQNKEPSVDNDIEVKQSDMVHSILKKIIAHVVRDGNITIESKNMLMENVTSELSDISHSIVDKNSSDIITTKDRNKISDITAKEDVFKQELSVNEIKSDWRNELHIKSTSKGKTSDSVFNNAEIKELQNTYDSNNISLAKDKDKDASTSMFNTNGTTDAREENINANNIEQTKNEDIPSKILPENIFLENIFNNSSPNNEINSEVINNIVEQFDGAVDNNLIEVVNDKDQFSELSTDNNLMKADANDEKLVDKVDNSANRLEANDITREDSIKKVKFSVVNMGLERETELSKRRNNPTTNDIYELIESDAYKTSKDVIIVKSIHFAPPNHNLLSDADEPWPNDLYLPMIKVTLSVSKSVSSLGKLTETEEKYTTPSEEKDKILFKNYKEPVINISAQQIQTVNKLLLCENKVTEYVESFLGSDDSTETEWKSKEYRDSGDTKNDFIFFHDNSSETPKRNEEKHIITGNKILGVSIDLNDKKDNPTDISKHTSVIFKKKYNSKENDCSRDTTFLSKLTIVHTPFINISPYKSKNIASINEKIIQTDTRDLKNLKLTEYQINKTEVSKWCQGLENVINNLEIWSSWVKNTCTYIVYFKHNEYKSPKITKSIALKWTKLQEDVKLDAVLWFNLSKDLQIGLHSYRNYYEYPRVRMMTARNILKSILKVKYVYRSLCLPFEFMLSNM